jgi:hypothetical protein
MEIAVKKEMPAPAFAPCDLNRLTGLSGIDQQNPARRELRFVFTAAGMDNDFVHDRKGPRKQKRPQGIPCGLTTMNISRKLSQ